MAPHRYKWPLTAASLICFAGARCLWYVTGGKETRLGEFVPLFCPLLHFFHIQCPTCGFGRSTFLAFNGKFAEAIHFHFLGPALLVLLVASTLTAWIAPKTLKNIFDKGTNTMRYPMMRWGLITSYCLYGIIRNI